jgi:hypothetical protein
MTTDDFQRWMTYHQSKFTGVMKWLASYPKDADDEYTVTRSSIATAWYTMLRPIDLEQAKLATDLMGNPDHPEPKGFDRHPQAILAICHVVKRRRAAEPQPTPKVVDGHTVYVCPECRDTGAITVWHPTTMAAAKDGALQECSRIGKLYTVSVGCHLCQCWSVVRGGIVFDPKRMIKAPLSLQDRDALAELERFCKDDF